MLDNAIDQSTYFVEAAFQDEEGVPVVPSTLSWSLYDGDGDIVNSKLDEAITPAASVTICLSGNDLIHAGDLPKDFRCVLFKGTYTSTFGEKPIRKSAEFYIASACS